MKFVKQENDEVNYLNEDVSVVNMSASTNMMFLPLNSKIGFNGDSIMAEGYVKNGNTIYYNSQSVASWVMLMSNHKMKVPVNGFIATSGFTTMDVLAYIDVALALKLDVVVINPGTNDIALDYTAKNIISHLAQIYAAHIENGTNIIDLVILPRFGAKELTPNQKIQSDLVNQWKRTQTDFQTIVIDPTAKLNASHFYDGLHPNKYGSKIIGGDIATAINSFLVAKGKITDNVRDATNFIKNGIELSGVDGYMAGGTGQIATGFNLGVYNLSGVNIVASKESGEYNDVQALTISGNYTGEGDISFNHDATVSLALHDVILGFVDFELVSETHGLKAINLILNVYDDANNLLQTAEGFSSSGNNIEIPFDPKRYQMRTPQLFLDVGTPAKIRLILKLIAHTTNSSESINADIKIYKIGAKKALV